ncbi:MAG: DUF6273 domain-containing protein [Oscillospiraceae bacterium]|nr:DUF6273 domain-containing protein [Oscillospiraceae bacterium]
MADIVAVLKKYINSANQTALNKKQLMSVLMDEHVTSWQVAWFRLAADSTELLDFAVALSAGKADSFSVQRMAQDVKQLTNLDGEMIVGWVLEAYGVVNQFIKMKQTDTTMPELILSQGEQKNENEITAITPVIGSTIEFGPYSWLVLGVKDNRALLLADEILERRPFDAYRQGKNNHQWENSDIRKYLNSGFISRFSSGERIRIASVQIDNKQNYWSRTGGTPPTNDKVFLLSVEEADKYFGNSMDYMNMQRKEVRNGTPCPNAHSEKGSWISNRNDTNRIAYYRGKPHSWWLRTCGNGDIETYVYKSGAIDLWGGTTFSDIYDGVRPALWLHL